ncbi:Lipoyl synthase [compost metagenome]
MRDMRSHGVSMLTVGQYLQPRPGNLPVERYVAPAQFEALAQQAHAMGFAHAACGPLVRSSYHADRQAHAAGV